MRQIDGNQNTQTKVDASPAIQTGSILKSPASGMVLMTCAIVGCVLIVWGLQRNNKRKAATRDEAEAYAPLATPSRVTMSNSQPRPQQRSILRSGRKRVLVVLFVPSVERDGVTPVDQAHWVDAALAMFGRVFGGATAYPKATGIWRDDERNGALIKDEPVVIHCYTTPPAIQNASHLAALGRFCREMGRECRQGEIGLVVGDEYFAIRDFDET